MQLFLSLNMSRFLLLSSLFLQFCSNGLAADGASDSNEVDGLEGKYSGTKSGTDEGEDNTNDGLVPMMGIDYFSGVSQDKNENGDYDNFHLAKQSRDYEDLGEIVILDPVDARNYKAEIDAGNKADVLGVNPHYFQPELYPDFGRRFVLQYPYKEVAKKKIDEVKPNNLKPKLVSPELFMAVAQKSALLDAARPKNNKDEIVRKNILRNGDYWNAVWKEDLDPLVLRTKQTKKLESVKAEIPPGSKLYDLLSKLKHLSPTLLYVINERDS